VILDRCKELTGCVAEKRRLRQNVDQLKRFQKVRDLVQRHATRLVDLVTVLRAFKETGVGTVTLSSQAKDSLLTVTGAREKFRTKTESLVEDKEFSSVGFSNALATTIDTLEEALKDAWGKYAESKTPAANPDVLSVLEPAFPREVRLIRERSNRLAVARLTLPKSAGQVREFDAQVAELQKAWGQLGGGEVPAAVLTFLRAAAGETGARIELLTDEVRRWLEVKKIARSFSIRVSS
jgi:hypothetical protein